MSESTGSPHSAGATPVAAACALLRCSAAAVVRQLIVSGARLLTGLRALGSLPGTTATAQTVYFANHTSHGDFVLLWAALPASSRSQTRPVAGQDYWGQSPLRRFIGSDVFHALMIRRDGSRSADPLAQMTSVLHAGHSLILFPEGTRNTSDVSLLPFKSGIYHLGLAFPDVQFVPVWIDNLQRVLPKGAWLPVPLACSVHFGDALSLQPGEDKPAFLQRARQALLALQPAYDREAAPACSSTK